MLLIVSVRHVCVVFFQKNPKVYCLTLGALFLCGEQPQQPSTQIRLGATVTVPVAPLTANTIL